MSPGHLAVSESEEASKQRGPVRTALQRGQPYEVPFGHISGDLDMKISHDGSNYKAFHKIGNNESILI